MCSEKVLKILKENMDSPVSGEDISRLLGVSRMTVSNAVKELRQNGYDITSATRRGYCLRACADHLGFGDIAPLVPDREGELICLPEVDSTNTYLKKLAVKGAPHGTVVIADRQTGGRGRLGRNFESPGGVGVYLSMLLRPKCAPGRALSITAGTAVAMCAAIKEITGCSCGIKWMNDIILDGRKICGILTEMSIEAETNGIQYIVVGAGVNVNNPPESFSGEVREIAGSIFSCTGKTAERCAIAAAMVRRMDEMYSNWLRDDKWCLEEYRRLCVNLGRDAVIKQTGELVHVLNVSDDFSLTVKTESGFVKNVSSGEVSLRSAGGQYI